MHPDDGASAHVFNAELPEESLFYNMRFDFVARERTADGRELPIFAIELDGKEHKNDEAVKRRDAK